MRPLSNQQRLNLVNTEQLYESWLSTRHRIDREFRYGMRWKRVREREYLFRAKDRKGHGESLGPRSPETEQILESYNASRANAMQRIAGIDKQLTEQARLNKALRLDRVPSVVAKILRELDQYNLRDSFTVLGTQAMYGYEAAGGVHFLLELLASGDVDLLYDARQQVTLVSSKLDGHGLLGLLQGVDRTFECVRKRGFRAANAGQFMVDLIIAPRPMQKAEAVTFAPDDLVASEVPGLQWLVNVPKLETVAIDEDGMPAPFRVPDPRAFALHKAWLSGQTSREPVKQQRDLAQARAIAALVMQYMPQYSFEQPLTALHEDVRNARALLDLQHAVT